MYERDEAKIIFECYDHQVALLTTYFLIIFSQVLLGVC
jgi:hypothetical protein